MRSNPTMLGATIGVAFAVVSSADTAVARLYQPASISCFEENDSAVNSFVDSTGIFSDRTLSGDEFFRCAHTDDGQYGGYNTYSKFVVRVHDRTNDDGEMCQAVVYDLASLGSSYSGSWVYTSDPGYSATSTYTLNVDFPFVTLDEDDALAILRCGVPQYDSIAGYSGIAMFHVGSTSS